MPLGTWTVPDSPCRDCTPSPCSPRNSTSAARPGIAQPPLSRQVRRLEGKVGHALFGRGPGRVALTPDGRERLPAARRALPGRADGRAGRRRPGSAASLALTVLPGLLRTFRERFPEVRPDIHEMTTAPQIAALHEGAVDIGPLHEPPPTRRRWASRPC